MTDLQLTKLVYRILNKSRSDEFKWLDDYEYFTTFLVNTISDFLPNIDWDDFDTVTKVYTLLVNNYNNLKDNNLNPNNFIPYTTQEFVINYDMDFTEVGVTTYKTTVVAPTQEIAKLHLLKMYDNGEFNSWNGEEINKHVYDFEEGELKLRNMTIEGTKLSQHSKMLMESSDAKAFIPQEVFIFRKIQKELKELKTKDKIIGKIKEILDYMGFDPLEAMYYYYIFTSNFREDGRYDLTKKSELKSIQDLKSVKTKNTDAGIFAKAKIPFKGSNLEGFWEKDLKGTDQYIITSYGWYPIYIFKNGEWYKINQHYSSSTGKQISNVGLGYDKPRFDRGEMNAIRMGKDPKEVKNEKYKYFVKDKKQNYLNKKLNRKIDLMWLSRRIPELSDVSQRTGKVDFIIKDIKLENQLPVIYVDVSHGGFTTNTGAYLNREYAHPSAFSKGAEEVIKQSLQQIFYEDLNNLNDLKVVVNHPNAKSKEVPEVTDLQ